MSEPPWRQIQQDAGETSVPAEPEHEMTAFLFVCETLNAEPIDTLGSGSGASGEMESAIQAGVERGE